MSAHNLTVPLLLGNGVPASSVDGVVSGAVQSVLVEIAPAYDFQREDGGLNWSEPRPFATDEASITITGLEDTDINGVQVTWLMRITFRDRGNKGSVRTSLFQIAADASDDLAYPSDVTLVDEVQPPEYGPTWAEQAEAAKDAAVVAKTAAEAAAASVQREQVNGVAGLDGTGLVYLARLPLGVKTRTGLRPVGQDEVAINLFDQAGVVAVGTEGIGGVDSTAALDALTGPGGKVQTLAAQGVNVRLELPYGNIKGTLTMATNGLSLMGRGRIYGSVIQGVPGSAAGSLRSGMMVQGITLSPGVSADGFTLYNLQESDWVDVKVTSCLAAVRIKATHSTTSQINRKLHFRGFRYTNADYALYAEVDPLADWKAVADLIWDGMGTARTTHLHFEGGFDGLILTPSVRQFFAGFGDLDPTKQKHLYSGSRSDQLLLSGQLFEAGLEAIDLTNPKYIQSDAMITWSGQRAPSAAYKITRDVEDPATLPAPKDYRTWGRIGGSVRQHTGPAVSILGNGDVSGLDIDVQTYTDAVPSYYYGAGSIGSTRRRFFTDATLQKQPRIARLMEVGGAAQTDDTNGQATSSKVFLSPRSALSAVIKSYTVTATTALDIANLASVNGKNTMSGEIKLEVQQVTSSADPLMSSYTLSINIQSSGSSGPAVTVVTSGGLAAFTGSNASVPTFTFTIASGKLRATPTFSCAGAFTFSFTTTGNLIAY